MKELTANDQRRTRSGQGYAVSCGSPSAVLCQGKKPLTQIKDKDWDLLKKVQHAKSSS